MPACSRWTFAVRRLAILGASLLAALALAACAGHCHARPGSMAELAEINDLLIKVPLAGPIPALYRPSFIRIQDAELKLSTTEPVFVVLFPTGPRIYPQTYMVWHQVVNELIDDHAYAVTYCPLTGTLAAYDASLHGVNLVFEVVGHESDGKFISLVYDGNTVLQDRNTGSLWLQETGMAFDGPLMGRGMPTMPVFWTSWDKARKGFPNARVMAQPRGRRPYGRDPYGSYMKEDSYYDNDTLFYQPRRSDRRFAPKTPMYCLELGELLTAIDIGYVKKKGAVNFFLGPHALLAVHDQSLGVIRVFDRQIWAEPFLFVMRDGKLTDLASNSTWDPQTGAAVSGNMRGSAMKQKYGIYSMWFAWASINPETFTVPGPGEVEEKFLRQPPGGKSSPAGGQGSPAE